MDGQYEVLNPWAEVDPVPLKGLTPRVADLKGKTVGLFSNNKVAATPIVGVVERKLKERFPTLNFSLFVDSVRDVTESEAKGKFEDWLKGVDTVVASVAD